MLRLVYLLCIVFLLIGCASLGEVLDDYVLKTDNVNAVVPSFPVMKVIFSVVGIISSILGGIYLRGKKNGGS